ncbi:MAG: ribosome maturation factor RimM [Oscillospiraceae bacterium]|nr:ribosome maturation factor RimM [Oscillospiraceae bacterium]
MSDNFLEAGKIVNVHGLRGEVKIMPWCDGPDFLCEFDYLYLDKNGNRELEIEKARVFKNMVIAKFRDVDTVEDAEKLREKVLYISRDDVELDEDTYFIKDLIGIRVIDDETEKEYGVIKDVFQTGANDVYTVRNNEKEYLVPAIADVIISTDIDNKLMRIRPLKGLFEDED